MLSVVCINKTILGNTYWKTQWPKWDDPPTATFDLNIFWKHRGPLFFGDIWSADVAAGHDPTCLLPCHCGVQMSMADDPDICQVILYYLNSFYVYEVKAMECLQFKATFEKQWRQQKCGIVVIVISWIRRKYNKWALLLCCLSRLHFHKIYNIFFILKNHLLLE